MSQKCLFCCSLSAIINLSYLTFLLTTLSVVDLIHSIHIGWVLFGLDIFLWIFKSRSNNKSRNQKFKLSWENLNLSVLFKTLVICEKTFSIVLWVKAEILCSPIYSRSTGHNNAVWYSKFADIEHYFATEYVF